MNRCHSHCHPCEPPVHFCCQSLTCNLDCSCRIETVSATVSGDVLQLTINPITPESKHDYIWDVCIPIPPLTGTVPGTVLITDGTNNYSLSDTNGDPVTPDKLHGKSVYCVRFGNGGVAGTGTYPKHFTVKYHACHEHCGAKLPCQCR